jgi:hypothetical protein
MGVDNWSSRDVRTPSAPWTEALLPLFLGFAAFAAGVPGDFVLDDRFAILGHPAVTGNGGVAEAFALTFWGRPLDVPPVSWRPLTTLSFRLDYGLFGASPLGFHASSLAWYLATIFVAWSLARAWIGPRAACLAACIFAVLPVHAEAVSGLVGRADTLSLLFSAVALLLVAPGPRIAPIGPVRLAVAATAYLAALLAKESAIYLPAVAAVLAESPRNRLSPVVRRHAGTLALASVALAYLGARLVFLPPPLDGYLVPDDVLQGAAAWQRIAFGLELVTRYLRILGAPVDLCTGRKYAEVALPGSMLSIETTIGALVLVAAAWVSVRDLRSGRPAFLLFAGIAGAMFSNIVFPVPEAMADRFMMAPSLFLAMAVAGPAARWVEGSRPRRILLSVSVVLFACLSAWYATRWWSTQTLFEQAVTACPDSVHNQTRYAEILSDRGRHADAAWHFAVASEGRRRFPGPWSHPALDAETDLTADERVARMHSLLGVDMPEGQWRHAFAAFLAGQGRGAEARLVLESARPEVQQPAALP